MKSLLFKSFGMVGLGASFVVVLGGVEPSVVQESGLPPAVMASVGSPVLPAGPESSEKPSYLAVGERVHSIGGDLQISSYGISGSDDPSRRLEPWELSLPVDHASLARVSPSMSSVPVAPTSTSTTSAPVAPTSTSTTSVPVVSGGVGRPVVMADSSTVLDQPDTIYDFGFGSPGDVVILASGVEARNIRGPGLRRIGERNGQDITDSGFRNFEFTFAHIHMSARTTVTRPYFVNGTDVSAQPSVGDGDIMQIFAYGGDIVEPLVENVTAFGKQRQPGSKAHNDTLQFAGIQGGHIVDPTVRNCNLEGASNAAIQVGDVVGTMTIEGCVLSERFESWHAVNATRPEPGAVILWRDNTLKDGSSAAFLNGWTADPASNGLTGNITVQ